MQMTSRNPFSPRLAFVLLSAALVIAVGLSMAIPAFSKNPAKAYVSHPRLFPLYYQTNMDGPGELISSLGFPFVFRDFSLRVNRPLVPGLVALVRGGLARPLFLAHLPARWRAIQWGRWSAVDTLATYFLWLFFNLLFLALAVWLLYRTFSKLIGRETGILSALFLLLTPIVILSLREIQYGCLEILITAASFAFWAEATWCRNSIRRLAVLSFAVGVLFLGKLAASTFLAGAVLYGIFRRQPAAIAYVALAAVPSLLWVGICRILQIPYHFAEVSGYDQVVWVAKVNSVFDLGRQALAYAQGWALVLWESMGLFHIVLACAGAWYLLQERRYNLLALIPCFALADFAFYLLVHRLHAVYGLHTMVLVFALAAKGLHGFFARTGWSKRSAMIAGFLVLVIIQTWINLHRLPMYGG